MSVPQVEIAINTQSEPIPVPTTAPIVPTITINGNALSAASNQPFTASGWQVAVLDQAQDLTTPAAVTSNRFISLQADGNNWGYWEAMYSMMTTQLLTSGNPGAQIVIVTSFGLDANLPPTNDALELLLTYGAGPQLQGWLTSEVDIGSEGANWTNTPANYVFIGASGLSYGTGTEAFNIGTNGGIAEGATATFANPAAAQPPAEVPAA
jgi:hypothetical protein